MGHDFLYLPLEGEVTGPSGFFFLERGLIFTSKWLSIVELGDLIANSSVLRSSGNEIIIISWISFVNSSMRGFSGVATSVFGVLRLARSSSISLLVALSISIGCSLYCILRLGWSLIAGGILL